MIKLLLSAALLALPLAAAAKGNPESGKARALKGDPGQRCADCHGEAGSKPLAPTFPVLAGQHYDYLVRALSDYKNGRRTNAIMKMHAAPLSKKEIEDLAAWFASQKSNLHDQR